MWKISWPSPFPYMVNTWPSPILILRLHVHWFTTVFNYDPSLTMTSFLIPIIYNVLLSATSIEFLALRSNERSFHWNKLSSGNGETVAEFSPNYIVPQKKKKKRKEKETPLREELQLQAQNMMKRKGFWALKHPVIVNIIERIEWCKRQPCTATVAISLNVKLQPKENTGLLRQLRALAEQEEWMNLTNGL